MSEAAPGANCPQSNIWMTSGFLSWNFSVCRVKHISPGGGCRGHQHHRQRRLQTQLSQHGSAEQDHRGVCLLEGGRDEWGRGDLHRDAGVCGHQQHHTASSAALYEGRGFAYLSDVLFQGITLEEFNHLSFDVVLMSPPCQPFTR